MTIFEFSVNTIKVFSHIHNKITEIVTETKKEERFFTGILGRGFTVSSREQYLGLVLGNGFTAQNEVF